MVSSASLTKRFAARSNACLKVKLRSPSALIICADWIRSSAVFHTSTSGDSSVVRRVVVSGAGTCSLMPKNTRLLSSLHVSAARSLITQPLRKPSAFAGSRTIAAAFPSASSSNAARTSGKASRTVSFSRIFSTSDPLRTASAYPSSFHASRLYCLPSLSSAAIRPLRVSNTNTPLPSLIGASTV